MEDIVNFHNKNHCKQRDSVWSDVIQEVAKRKAAGLQANIFSERELKVFPTKARKKVSKKYGLGAKYNSIYFTKREAECMVGLIKGKAIDDIAAKLVISPCMVMEHIESMKTKIGCCTTSNLIDLVCSSEFLKNIDF